MTNHDQNKPEPNEEAPENLGQDSAPELNTDAIAATDIGPQIIQDDVPIIEIHGGEEEENIEYDEATQQLLGKLNQTQKYSRPEPMLQRLHERKIPHFKRQASECTEIVIGNHKFIFASTKNFPRAKLFVFNLVAKDVTKWLQGKSEVGLPPSVENQRYNFDYDDSYGHIAGTDLNHAYWRIAFLKGIISEPTYNHGLVPENLAIEGKIKALRLATLSVLGREKRFDYYGEDGNVKHSVVTQAANPLRKQVYTYIRQVCYNMMRDLSIKLGKDFESWNVDCIYYRDTPENRKLVSDYFTGRNMTFKQLDWFPENDKTQ